MPDDATLGSAIIYCRGATMYSIWAQEEVCESHLWTLPYKVGMVVSDLSVSDAIDRPKLSDIRQRLRSGEFAALVASEPAVISRVPGVVAQIRADCERSGVALIFAHE